MNGGEIINCLQKNGMEHLVAFHAKGTSLHKMFATKNEDIPKEYLTQINDEIRYSSVSCGFVINLRKAKKNQLEKFIIKRKNFTVITSNIFAISGFLLRFYE